MSRESLIAELEPMGAAMATTFAVRNPKVTRDEMLSAASLAIIESVDRYDGSGMLTTFAHPRIRGQMITDMRAIMGIGQHTKPPKFTSIESVQPELADDRSGEVIEEVEAVLSTLQPNHQHPARTILLGGLSSHECAKATRTPVGICKRAAREARRLLKARLGHA